MIAVCVSVLFRSRVSVSGKDKIGFPDFLFDALRRFSGFSLETCASTTSIASTSSQILLAVLIEIYFSYAVFYDHLYGFAVSYILLCPPPHTHFPELKAYRVNNSRLSNLLSGKNSPRDSNGRELIGIGYIH